MASDSWEFLVACSSISPRFRFSFVSSAALRRWHSTFTSYQCHNVPSVVRPNSTSDLHNISLQRRILKLKPTSCRLCFACGRCCQWNGETQLSSWQTSSWSMLLPLQPCCCCCPCCPLLPLLLLPLLLLPMMMLMIICWYSPGCSCPCQFCMLLLLLLLPPPLLLLLQSLLHILLPLYMLLPLPMLLRALAASLNCCHYRCCYRRCGCCC